MESKTKPLCIHLLCAHTKANLKQKQMALSVEASHLDNYCSFLQEYKMPCSVHSFLHILLFQFSLSSETFFGIGLSSQEQSTGFLRSRYGL